MGLRCTFTTRRAGTGVAPVPPPHSRRPLDPAADISAIRANLDTIPAVCRGGPEAGPIGELPARGRFRWLVSPRSTIIQPSAVRTGRMSDPAASLEQMMDRVVRRPRAET
jgi:hypothetical protein